MPFSHNLYLQVPPLKCSIKQVLRKKRKQATKYKSQVEKKSKAKQK